MSKFENAKFSFQIHFIREQIPRDVKIHLVGHSIGSYISMELLKTPDINDQIQHCYLLFPTIEYMVCIHFFIKFEKVNHIWTFFIHFV